MLGSVLAVDAMLIAAEHSVVRIDEIVRHAETCSGEDEWANLRKVSRDRHHLLVDFVTILEKTGLLFVAASRALAKDRAVPWLLLFGRVFYNRGYGEYAQTTSRSPAFKLEPGGGNAYALTGIPLAAKITEPSLLPSESNESGGDELLKSVRKMTWDRTSFLLRNVGEARTYGMVLPANLPQAVRAVAVSCRAWVRSKKSHLPCCNVCANQRCRRSFPAARHASHATRKAMLADVVASYFQTDLSGERSARTRLYWLFVMGLSREADLLESGLAELSEQPQKSEALALHFCSRTCAEEYVREVRRRLPASQPKGWQKAEGASVACPSRSLVPKALDMALKRSAQCERALRCPHLPTAASMEDHALVARLCCEAINVDIGVLGASQRVAESAVLAAKKTRLPGSFPSWRLDRMSYARPVREVKTLLLRKPTTRFFTNPILPPPFFEAVQTRAATIV